MVRSIRLFPLILAVLSLAPLSAPAPAEPGGAKVFEPVWYRSERIGLRLLAFQASGRLEVGAEALDFRSRKRALRIPWTQMESVKLGKLRQDQGNEWVIVRYTGEDGSRAVAGFTDGRKLGWSQRTGEIFEAVEAAFRAAQPLPRLLEPVVRRVEASTAASPGLGPVVARLPLELKEGEQQLARYTREHTDEVGAWTLLARVSFLVRASSPAPHSPEEPPGRPDPDLAVCRDALEHALRLAPDDPRVLCRAARVLGTPYAVREGGGSAYRSLDPAGALRFARRSVELDPAPGGCRGTLALLLGLAGRWQDALDSLDDRPGEVGPLRVLLENRVSLPLPDGAVPLPRRSLRLAVERFRAGRVTDLPTLRVRAYLIPAGASGVEAFYRARWKKFTWLASRSEPGEKLRVQFLRPGGGRTRWAPVRRASMIPPVPSGGVSLELLEDPHPDAELRTAAGERSGPRSVLTLVDFTTTPRGR